MPRRDRHYSRRYYRRGLLDFAYTCAACGEIRLGPPAVDPRTPPDPPYARCKVCGACEWIESVVPAFDPSVLDPSKHEIRTLRTTVARYAAVRRPMPDYYSTDDNPKPAH